MIFDLPQNGSTNKKIGKKCSAKTADVELQLRAGAKEGGGGEGKPPPGLGGLGRSDWKEEKFGGPEERRGALHADPVGRRIHIFIYVYIYICICI